MTPHSTNHCSGCEDIHKFHLHGHADGEEHADIGDVTPHPTNHCSGGEDIHKFHLHGHADGEEHANGVGLPQDKGVLQGEARTGVSGMKIKQYMDIFFLYKPKRPL